MLEDPPLLTVRRTFARPSAAQLKALAGVPTGYVVDAMNGRGALDSRIKPVPGTPDVFTGTVITCQAGPADNLALFGAVYYAQRGDVILCAADGFAQTSVTGDLLIGMAKNRGVAAFVTDGMVRDTPGIQAVGLPCFAAGVTPNSPVRSGPGTVGQPIVIGGVAANAGDVAVADVDGVVVIPHAMIDAVIERLVAIRAAEAAMEAKVKAGLEIPPFIQQLVETGRFKLLD